MWPASRPVPGKREESPETDGPVVRGERGEEGEGEGLSMSVLVEQQLQSQKLSLLSERNLTEALGQFVKKEDTDAISE